MKKNYRPNKILIGLLLLLGIFLSRSHLSHFLLELSRPLFRAGGSFAGLFWGNDSLVQENLKLKSELSLCGALRRQNEELKAALSRKAAAKKYIIASVLSRPPQSPYDIFVVDAGFEEGVKKGANVTAFGSVLVGRVFDVSKHTSRIKLISFPGEETNILIENKALSAGAATSAPISSAVESIPGIARGRGGGSFEVLLPREIEVNSGDMAVAPGMEPLVVGKIGKVQTEAANPFQKIFLSFPLNIYHLEYVLIEGE